MRSSIVAIFSCVLSTVAGCSADRNAATPASQQSVTERSPNLDPLNAFAQADIERFLNVLPADDWIHVAESYQTFQWKPVAPRSPTAVQGVESQGTTVVLDERSRAFIQGLFDRYVNGQISDQELSRSVRTLDAIYASILRSHASLNKPSVDSMHLSLTYAALGRATLSQRLHELGIEDPPVDKAGVATLMAAARSRDYEQVEMIVP